MRKFIIYHNPRCSKSRQALTLLADNGIEPIIVEYLKQPLSITELKRLTSKLNINILDLLRKKESKCIELDLIHQSEDDIYRAMHEHPKLMERPIIELENKAVIGRPIENIISLINQKEA